MHSLLVLLVLVSMASAFVPSIRVMRTSQALNAIKQVVNDDEPIENVLKNFKRKVNQSGHLMDMRFREQWETVAERKKRKLVRNRQLDRIERTNERYDRMAEGASEYNS